MPVSVGFWYHLHMTFFPESTLTFKSKKAKRLLGLNSSMVNCKFGCNYLAASRTTPGLPLTVLTMSSTYLGKIFTPFSVRSGSCYFLQVMQNHTDSAMSAYSDSECWLFGLESLTSAQQYRLPPFYILTYVALLGVPLRRSSKLVVKCRTVWLT